MMKRIDLDIVRRATEELLLDNMYTTTLDVKNYLREKGFFALQADVSDMMDELYHLGFLWFEFTGAFRIYLFAEEVHHGLTEVSAYLNGE
ncbi:hypothetical protein V6R21_31610 [Limibacter armeniacum]|uniref:hypothetical protein n=1 Tax=Limibacter armeniacum TaxID=466084 RepID=UPI002FE530FC